MSALAAWDGLVGDSSSSYPTNKIWRIIPFILALLVGLYLQTSIINGHQLNEDYAAYLQEAYNIAHHQPVDDMGVDYYFDPNLALAVQGPATYPLLLPLLYAVPVAIFGYDIQLIKELRLVLLVATLLVFSHAMRRWGFTALEIVVSLIVFGLATPVHGSVNSIDSDLPFLFFLIIALVAIEKATRAPPKAALAWGVAMGVAIYLATQMRTVGIVLLPTAWLVGVIRNRRIVAKEFIAAGVSFCAIFGAQRLLIGTAETYGSFLSGARFFTPLENLNQFRWALENDWRDANQGVQALVLILVALAGIGVVREAVRGTAAAIFLVGYTVLLLILPNFDAGTRYLYPYFLFLGAFACRGASVIIWPRGNRFALLSKYLAVGTAIMAVFVFSISDRAYPVGLKAVGTSVPATKEVFAFIEKTAPANALVSASSFRSFHLFTNHRTIPLLATRDPDELSSWLKEKKVDYVVLKYTPVSAEIRISDCPRAPLCASDQPVQGANEIWHNSEFRVYQVRRE